MTAPGRAAQPSVGVAAPQRWFGPPSLLGVVVGMLVAATPYLGIARHAGLLVVLPFVVGVLLLAVRGRPRQLGTGLVVSAFALPLTVLLLPLGMLVSR